jgi:protein TonB
MKDIFVLLMLFYSIDSFSQIIPEQEDNTIYNTAGIDVKPEFPGGLDKLILYVNESYFKIFPSEVKGKVYLIFVVEKDGSLSGIKLLRGIDPHKAKELIRIVQNSPKWSPGKQNGQTVRVLYTVTITIGQ